MPGKNAKPKAAMTIRLVIALCAVGLMECEPHYDAWRDTTGRNRADTVRVRDFNDCVLTARRANPQSQKVGAEVNSCMTTRGWEIVSR
jgi:hypothetical protein